MTTTPIPNLSIPARLALAALVDRTQRAHDLTREVRAELVAHEYLASDENEWFVTMAGELRASLASGDHGDVLDPRVRDTFVECECGCDRGDHMHEAPHACEPCGGTCTGFRARQGARVLSLTAHVQRTLLRGLAKGGPAHPYIEPDCYTLTGKSDDERSGE
jgi:hypothetical protein